MNNQNDFAHFSFTRSAYDSCELQTQLKQSTKPFELQTDKEVTESKDVCYEATSPFMHNPFRSIPSSNVDAESNLRGQTRPLSRCPEKKYNPNTEKNVDYKMAKDCSTQYLVPEYTRNNKSCDKLSGISINRFHPLCEDVQEIGKIHSNNYFVINTRLRVKDAFAEKKNKKD